MDDFFEVQPETELSGFIHGGPKMAALMAKDVVRIDPANSDSAGWMSLIPTDTNLILVAMCACVVVFAAVLSAFMANRERVRRYVTGENRRVGSVYYVRPGIHATQPTEI